MQQQFSLVCSLLEAYVKEKQANSLIKAMIAIKKEAANKFIRKQNKVNRMTIAPSTTKFSQRKRKNIRFTTENSPYTHQEDDESPFWNEDNQSKTKRYSEVERIEGGDDEFEDLVLGRLVEIEKNIQELRNRKNRKNEESGCTSEQQRTLSLVQGFPKLQQKYIPMHKLREASVLKYNPDNKLLSFENSVEQSIPSKSYESQQSNHIFSQFQYKPTVSRSSNKTIQQDYSFSHSESSHQNCHHHQLISSCCGCPVYLIPSTVHYHCGCQIKKGNKRGSNISFDLKKNGKRKTMNSSYFK